MDLTDMMKTPHQAADDLAGGRSASDLMDHSWYEEGLVKDDEFTYDPVENHNIRNNETKTELEIEWGRGSVDINPDEPAGEVQRNIPKDKQFDAGPVIMFARDQMNRGLMGKDLARALTSEFDSDTLVAARDGLKSQLSLEGIIGCVAVDGRGYDDCKQALLAAQKSPYKRFIKYVIGCDCGTPVMVPDERGQAVRVSKLSDTLNRDHAHSVPAQATDAFFAEEQQAAPAERAYCRSTMMPLVAGRGDLDPSEMDGTLIEVINITGLPAGKVQDVIQMEASALDKAKKVFRMAHEAKVAAAEAKYAEKVEVDPLDNIQANMEVELDQARDASELEVDREVAPVAFEVPTVESSLDIELGHEFGAGMDIVGLDEPKEALPDLEVNPYPEITL